VPLFADPTYTFFKVPGAQATSPTSINLFGTVTGSYYDGTNTHGFVRDPSGKVSTFDVPGSTGMIGTRPQDINIAGTIVGEWGGAFPSSFMRDSKGTITAFYPPQFAGISGAYGINAEGATVGYAMGPPPPTSYVRLPDGTFQMFQVKSEQTYASAINLAFLVTGSYLNNGIFHGFVGRPNSQAFATFDPPGSVQTNPHSINSVGAITGWYWDADTVSHGFVRDPQGNIVSFDAVGSQNTSPMVINDFGAIVGNYSDSNGASHGFVRDPQGTLTVIDPPGSNETYAAGINDVGVITGGFSKDGGKTWVGFVRTP
jgi:hypothetical protein